MKNTKNNIIRNSAYKFEINESSNKYDELFLIITPSDARAMAKNLIDNLNIRERITPEKGEQPISIPFRGKLTTVNS